MAGPFRIVYMAYTGSTGPIYWVLLKVLYGLHRVPQMGCKGYLGAVKRVMKPT